MKKIALLLAAVLVAASVSGCVGTKTQQYEVTWYTLFDTVTTVKGFAGSREEFEAQVQPIYEELLACHQLFDIYHDYEGINNLKTINDQAGVAPVTVDTRVTELLQDCRKYWELTGGRVNVAMGSVLRIWHEARDAGISDPGNAYLPDPLDLEAAAEHVSFDNVIIDAAAGTVYLSDPQQLLDVGAVAKGWAAQRAAELAPEGMLISVGGNVCATGPKDETGTPWKVGVQDPDDTSSYLRILALTEGSLVTSGDYQRYYTVDGVTYHHIIDPDTLYPGEYWRSVTIVCRDSGLADALSTALFLLPQSEGQELLDVCGAMAIWVAADGTVSCSPGVEELIQ